MVRQSSFKNDVTGRMVYKMFFLQLILYLVFFVAYTKNKNLNTLKTLKTSKNINSKT